MNDQMTYTDNLPSGVEIEIKGLLGIHQEWLTKGKGEKAVLKTTDPNQKGIEDVFADCCVRMGDDKNITKAKVLKMLSADFAYALLLLRFYSCDPCFPERMSERKAWEQKCAEEEKEAKDAGLEYIKPEYKSELPPHEFKFRYEWNDKAKGVKKQHDFSVEIYMWDFPTKPYDGAYDYNALFATDPGKDADILNKYITLERSKKKIRFTILSVEKEYVYKSIIDDVKKISSSTMLTMRNPCEMIMGEKVEAPLRFDFLKAPLMDNEQLRTAITDAEGSVDTVIIVPHPETAEDIRVNIVNVLTFFFPSGVV